MRLVCALPIALAATLFACSSDSQPSGGGSNVSPAGVGGRVADGQADVYAPGLTKAAGTMTVKLVEAKPGPPVKGNNELTLEVLDASGQPVDGATVTVTPWMPDHAHGSAVKPTVTPTGGGRYHVTDVYLAMAGLWQIKVDVQPAGGGALQEAVFQFFLDG
jgi:hypothetical protein